MNEQSKVLHSTHRNKNRHWHMLMLLVPSIVFVSILAFTIRNSRSNALGITTIDPTPQPTFQITVNETPVEVKLARTAEEHRQGLSGVASLRENEGLLFIFPDKVSTAFWMKDMLMPIDIIWIADNKIIQIDKNVSKPEPGTAEAQLKLYVPNSRIDHVLEVNAGFADAHQIEVGDSIDLSKI